MQAAYCFEADGAATADRFVQAKTEARHTRRVRARVGGSVVSLTLLCVGCGDAAPTIDRPDQPVWCPANVPTRQAFDARMLLGMSPDAGRGDAERQGCAFRVVMEDGEPQGGTADVREDRVEAVVEDDVVIEVRIG